MRAKYGKLCIDLTSFTFISDSKTLDIKSDDFKKMMSKQLSILTEFTGRHLVEIPLTTILESDETSIQFGVCINNENVNATITFELDDEYVVVIASER